MTDSTDYLGAALPDGVQSRRVDDVNGLCMHLLEAGDSRRPTVLLLHGFPELSWSWRRVMPGLAAAGFHVVAPDQRGYGLTTGWDGRYDGELRAFSQLNLTRDVLELVFALGLEEVRAVVGHDFGSPVAAHCALIRPDVFRAVVLMSAPFAGAPLAKAQAVPARSRDDGLAGLEPPRKHYQQYYSTRTADPDMLGAPQGLHAFLRAYYHVKSADWPGNRPHRLADWSAGEIGKLPDYYVMPLQATMPAAVAPYTPSAAEGAGCRWLPDDDLAVYVRAFQATGFQGGLNWYRAGTSGMTAGDLRLFAGRRIEVPALFIAGAADWGVWQSPGAFEAMQTRGCADFRGANLIQGAGHWVQQEQPEAVLKALLAFLED